MVNLTFNAIDVETANPHRASICQIGLVQVDSGRAGTAQAIMVNPEEAFAPFNINIHGINERRVRDAPTFLQVYPSIRSLLDGQVLLSHSRFDRQALEQATSKYGIEMPDARWLDSGRIARSAWPESYGRAGWGLKQIANDLGIKFQHHDAGEDAMVSAKILMHAWKDTGIDVDGWLEQAGYHPSSISTSTQPDPPDPAGPPNGEAPRQPAPPEKRTLRWDRSMTTILNLEEQKALQNSAVSGGIDRFTEYWSETIMEELGPAGVHRILLMLRYQDLEAEERRWWIAQWRSVIQNQGQ